MADQVDTRVTHHRKLCFNSVDDCIAEVHRILEADKAGKLSVTGNWNAGQILTHLASWIGYAYDGFPLGRPPFFVRWVLRLGLQKMLRDGMSRGVRIPGVKEGTYGMVDMGIAEAAERLLAALNRLQSNEVAKFDSPAFGRLSHEDRIRLNLRHAELHLGFFSY
jgi:hypothetical protein